VKNRNLNVFFGVILFLISCTASAGSTRPITDSDLFYSGEVFFGEKLLIDMHYSAFPLSSNGAADGFVWGPGSSSNGVVSTVTNFYIGDTLAASNTRYGGGYGGVFVVSGISSLGKAGGMWGAVNANDDLLDVFFGGSMSATLEIIPTFSNVNGHIRYSSWSPHGVTFIDSQQWEDIFPAPLTTSRIVGVNTPAIAPVPEPETYAMMLAGFGLMGFVARRRKSNGTKLPTN
jgi:hypothetical protein